MSNTQVMRDPVKGKEGSYVKEVNFRETEDDFHYRGVRGIVITKKGKSRESAYVEFIKALVSTFNPQFMYHQIGSHRFNVPRNIDEHVATEFLAIVDKTQNDLNTLIAA